MQLIQKLATSRRIAFDALDRHSSSKVTSDSSDAGSGSLPAKLTRISTMFDRLRYVAQSCYTLLRDQLNHVRAWSIDILGRKGQGFIQTPRFEALGEGVGSLGVGPRGRVSGQRVCVALPGICPLPQKMEAFCCISSLFLSILEGIVEL